MKRSVSHYVCTAAALAAVLCLSSCGVPKNPVTQEKAERRAATGESWTVMMYMSGGSDESSHGSASKAIRELMQIDYPGSLNVVMETGGTFKWQTEGIDTNYIDRFEAQKNGLYLAERQEADSMARNIVLTNFIDWCEENYPADHYALIINGGGSNSANGFAFDETVDNKSMTASTLADAIDNSNRHFDIIGFDCDLSASVETAYELSTCADYLIASQERMASGGWNYRDWLNYIINNPTNSVADIARAACDTYMDKCIEEKTDSMATMSATKLSGITNLSQAIDGMAGELSAASGSLSKYSELSRAIGNTMCFGANTKHEGFSNMIDLNDLVVKSGSATDKTSGRVQDELENSVIYRANGRYRQAASGLSVYYPLNQSSDELPKYIDLCPFKRYAEFLAQTCANADHGSKVTTSFTDTTAFADYQVERDLMQYTTVPGNTGIELNMTGNMDIVRSVSQRIFAKKDKGTLYLGNAAEIDENRAAGIFKTKNTFSFPMLNGHSLSLTKVYAGEGYTIYSAPIKIDNSQKNLRIADDRLNGESEPNYKILGLYDSLGTSARSSRCTTPINIYNLLIPMYEDYDTGELVDGESFKPWPFGAQIADKQLPEGSYKTDYSIEYIYCNAFATDAAEFDFIDNVISYK